MMNIEQCYKKLKEINAPFFIDLEFTPTDRSIFEKLVGNPFEIVPHWRRP